MLSLNKELQEKRSRFLRRLTENFEGVKITTALLSFDQMEFKAFVAELKKQKIKLSLIQQDEWEDYFNQYREACNQLSAQITQTDNEIDQRVFDLYGLTQEEREIVLSNH
jgi:predicted transcriptional regulator